MAEVLASLVPTVQRLLRRHGVEDEDVAIRSRRPSRSWRGGRRPPWRGWRWRVLSGGARHVWAMRAPRRLQRRRHVTRWEGFDLHAGVRIPAGQRDRLERVCRYALRPPLAGNRLHRTGAGDIALEFRRPWSDGTTHLVFAPVAFLARLAVLVPRPRVNLVRYYGVLAPRASWRAAVVSVPAPAIADSPGTDTRLREGRAWRWADLMRRVFAVDVLACPGCNGRLRLVAVLEASVATARILQHLRLPTEVPVPAPARASPVPDEWAD